MPQRLKEAGCWLASAPALLCHDGRACAPCCPARSRLRTTTSRRTHARTRARARAHTHARARNRYDVVPEGATSDEARELWLEITPQSFNVRMAKGQTLTQLMVFADHASRTAVMAVTEPAAAAEAAAARDTTAPAEPAAATGTHEAAPDAKPHSEQLLFDADTNPIAPRFHRGAVVLSLSVPSEKGALVGYEARETRDVIDMNNIGGHDPAAFFTPIYSLGDQRLCVRRPHAAPTNMPVLARACPCLPVLARACPCLARVLKKYARATFSHSILLFLASICVLPPAAGPFRAAAFTSWPPRSAWRCP